MKRDMNHAMASADLILLGCNQDSIECFSSVASIPVLLLLPDFYWPYVPELKTAVTDNLMKPKETKLPFVTDCHICIGFFAAAARRQSGSDELMCARCPVVNSMRPCGPNTH